MLCRPAACDKIAGLAGDPHVAAGVNFCKDLSAHDRTCHRYRRPVRLRQGTVAALVAARLGFHYLDSGSLYRLLALFAQRRDIAWDDEAELAAAAAGLPVEFADGAVWLAGEDASAAIRAEEIGIGASRVGALPAVRAALLQRQRDFARRRAW